VVIFNDYFVSMAQLELLFKVTKLSILLY